MQIRTILAAAVLGFATAAHGAAIIQPVAATTSLDGGGWDIAWSINQVGLDYSYVSGVTDFDTFTATVGHSGGWGWGFSGPSGGTNSSGTIDYDLGSEYLIESLALWDGQGPAGIFGQIHQFNVYTSNDPTFATANLVGGYMGTSAPFGYAAQVFAMIPSSGRYVRIHALSFYAGDISVGEIAFEGTPVPAPAATALLGMGGVMGLRRRRR